MMDRLLSAAGSSKSDKASPSPQDGDVARQAMQREVAAVHALHAEVGTVNPRPPGLHNHAIQFAKKAMRRTLAWYTRPLHQFHAAVSRALQEEARAIEGLHNELSAMKEKVEDLGKEQPELTLHHILRIDAELDKLRSLRLEERLLRHEIALRRWEAAPPAAAGPANNLKSSAVTVEPARQDAPLNFDYLLFESRFRGDETLIKNRQRSYVKCFRGRAPVLDLGCGRGEFLELMRESGIPSEGVEGNHDAFLLCREKGLPVSEGNLFDFLKSRPDGSGGGIFSAQVIEHLPVALQLELIDLAYRKLSPGSPLVLETINPECVFALVRNFYLDPTHVRPVHPEMLKFTLESKGFRDVELKFSSPVEGKFHEAGDMGEAESRLVKAVMEMNHFLFGYQDYAAIARRE